MTDWNLEKRIQGRIDRPLSAQGRSQLGGLSIPSDWCVADWYCSPLLRARETAELLQLPNRQIVPALIEMNWGEWEGQILKPLRRQLGEVMRENERRGLDFRPPGGESPREVQERVQTWLRQVAGSTDRVGAVVHKGIIRAVYALACGWDMRGESPVDFAWDALHLFELEADGSLQPGYRSLPLTRD